MTPEATYSALALLDRWQLTLAQLLGQPLPALPATPGRIFKAPEIPTVDEDAELIERRSSGPRSCGRHWPATTKGRAVIDDHVHRCLHAGCTRLCVGSLCERHRGTPKPGSSESAVRSFDCASGHEPEVHGLSDAPHGGSAEGAHESHA